MTLNIITVDEFKTYRKITVDKEDTKLSQLIEAASDLVKVYCNRTFVDNYTTPKIEYFDGTKVSIAYLEELPIVAISDVSYTTDGITYTSLVENTDYFVDDVNDSIVNKGGSAFITSGSDFPTKSLRVTYTGGYEEAPGDLKLAVLDIVEYYRTEQFTPRKAAGGATLENIGFRAGSSIGLPPHIKRILEMYRVQ